MSCDYYAAEDYWVVSDQYGQSGFPFTPSYTTSVNRKPRYLISDLGGGGYEQYARDGINTNPKVWSVNFTNISSLDADTVIEYFKVYKTWAQTFCWVDPDGDTGRFYCKKWDKNFSDAGYVTLTCEFQQGFGQVD